MAGKKAGKTEATQMDPVKVGAGLAVEPAEVSMVPTYVLRADVPEHRATLFGMVQAGRELRHALLPGLEKAEREFELFVGRGK